MAKAGGPATANGILYQILGTLGRAVEVSVQGRVGSNDLEEAVLVIEPVDGGDLQVAARGGRIVEQWKARSHERPWSLSELVEDVLPDLFGAADDDVEVYRFVTEGRIGTLKPVLAFFKQIVEPESGPVIAALDNHHPVKFARGRPMTERQLFSLVVDSVRRRSTTEDESEDALHRRVFRFLGRFEMIEMQSASELNRLVRDRLIASVDEIDDVEAKRHELCGRVLQLASRGDERIRPEALLRQAGLSPTSFLDWERLQARLRARLGGALERAGFVADLDVRGPFSLEPGQMIHVITGESGQGKTWALAALARAAAEGPGVVVWVPAARGGHQADTIAAEAIWRGGLEHDRGLSLESVAERRMRVNTNAPRPWALICVDGVHTRDEAEYLAGLDWEGWDIRLAISAPTEVARALQQTCGERVAIIELADFTRSELRTYMAHRAQPWLSVPEDMRDVLRRPILAQLYADLGTERSGSPHDEYELMDRYWRRIRDHRAGQPHDLALIRALASRLLEDPPVYPWPPEVLIAEGVGPDALSRLAGSGWLRENADGSVQFWHDRLMCWAVAQWLVQRAGKELSFDHVADQLQAIVTRTDSWRWRFGFVLLDTLWLLSDRYDPASEAWNILARFDTGRFVPVTTFAEESLPTLGARIVPIILDRLRHAAPRDTASCAHLAASTLVRVAKREPGAIRPLLGGWLNDVHPGVRDVALRLLAHLPRADLLDQVWTLDRQQAAEFAKEPAKHHAAYRASSKALAACLQLDPGWAGRQISSLGSDGSLLSQIAYALARTEGDAARAVWIEYKATLMARVPSEKRRCLINCIMRFRDEEELVRLETWAASTDEAVGGTAAWALALFNPDRAIGRLAAVAPEQLWLHARNLRDLLMGLSPQRACEEALRLAEIAPDEADAYLGLVVAGDRITAPAADAVVRELEDALEGLGPSPDADSWRSLTRPLERVDALNGHTPLSKLRDRRGSDLERRLAAAAVHRAGNTTGFVDHVFESALSVLLKIGGEGLTTVLNALLRSDSQPARLKGCELAGARPDAKTRRLVAELAQELPPMRPNAFPIVAQSATTTLAALGEGVELVHAIMRLGTHVSPDLRDARTGAAPLSDRELRPALQAMQNPTDPQHAAAILAVGLSGRFDLRDRVKEAFLRSPLDSEVALTAILALQGLGGPDQDLHDRLLQQYRSGHHKLEAAVLVSMGPHRAAIDLLDGAIAHAGPLDDADRRVMAWLRSMPEWRRRATYHRPRAGKGIDLVTIALEPKWLDPHDRVDRERLWELGDSSRSPIHVTGAKANAIERLAEAEPEAAFELAHQSLLSEPRDQDSMVKIMVRCDVARGLTLAFDHAVTTYDPAVCRRLAIGLRCSVQPARAADEVARRLVADDWRTRRVAAYMSSYLGAPLAAELRRTVLHDTHGNVCTTAICALRRLQQEAEARELIEMLGTAEDGDAWGICTAVVSLADPDVLSDRSDPLGFLEALRSRPYQLGMHIWRELDRRRKKTERDIASLARRWDE